MQRLFVFVILNLARKAQGSDYDAEQTLPNRKTMVHLFEWKWNDIAKECRNFLQHYGYGAVQVSPPNENAIVTNPMRPWYERYQPVSYELNTRSGNRSEFKNMVEECNNVGVRIIVDAVINHMTGASMGGNGTGGCAYSGGAEHFPCAGFGPSNFNDEHCRSPDGNIQGSDYGDNPHAVRHCRLSGLVDLKTGSEQVRNRIAAYMNGLIDMGVAGFRLDASKHMEPDDIKGILSKLTDLDANVFGEGQRPFIVQEVIDLGGDVITAGEYTHIGRVTNFKYGLHVAAAVLKNNDFAHFKSFDHQWQMWHHDSVLNFIDNHDNQRGHGGGGSILTHKQPKKYVLGVTYLLAWPYGYPRVMSSFFFEDASQGPPNTGAPNYDLTSPRFNADDTCKLESGYVCEHRWPAIRNMVKWREIVGPYSMVQDAVSESHRLAFHRGSDKNHHGFFALNNADSPWTRKLQTGLPEGTYCDLISGNLENNACTGHSIVVDKEGLGSLQNLASGKSFAVHTCSRIGSHCTNGNARPKLLSQTATRNANSNQRTVIYLYKPTTFGENVFIRGGLSKPGCNGKTLAENPCALSITHVDKAAPGDNYLDWNGREPRQDANAQGTPLVWTSAPFGEHHWKVEFEMDCSKTDNGWFEFKRLIPTCCGNKGCITTIGNWGHFT